MLTTSPILNLFLLSCAENFLDFVTNFLYIGCIIFLSTITVIVLSDLLDWCKRQDWLQDDRFYMSDASYEVFDDGASVPYIDLCLMSLCSGGIIANSSMSWWGAWLQNDRGKVVAPYPWYGAKAYNYGNAELCDADIIPERWIKIYNDPTPIDIVE